MAWSVWTTRGLVGELSADRSHRVDAVAQDDQRRHLRQNRWSVEFKTVNGGVKLSNVAGDFKGRTSNGGVDVDLDGPGWRGEGLDVETSNGGVHLRIPEHYSAHLETGTVNGGLNIDFPVTVQGRVDKNISADLGGGGAPIRVRTHNGGGR